MTAVSSIFAVEADNSIVALILHAVMALKPKSHKRQHYN